MSKLVDAALTGTQLTTTAFEQLLGELINRNNEGGVSAYPVQVKDNKKEVMNSIVLVISCSAELCNNIQAGFAKKQKNKEDQEKVEKNKADGEKVEKNKEGQENVEKNKADQEKVEKNKEDQENVEKNKAEQETVGKKLKKPQDEVNKNKRNSIKDKNKEQNEIDAFLNKKKQRKMSLSKAKKQESVDKLEEILEKKGNKENDEEEKKDETLKSEEPENQEKHNKDKTDRKEDDADSITQKPKKKFLPIKKKLTKQESQTTEAVQSKEKNEEENSKPDTKNQLRDQGKSESFEEGTSEVKVQTKKVGLKGLKKSKLLRSIDIFESMGPDEPAGKKGVLSKRNSIIGSQPSFDDSDEKGVKTLKKEKSMEKKNSFDRSEAKSLSNVSKGNSFEAQNPNSQENVNNKEQQKESSMEKQISLDNLNKTNQMVDNDELNNNKVLKSDQPLDEGKSSEDVTIEQASDEQTSTIHEESIIEGDVESDESKLTNTDQEIEQDLTDMPSITEEQEKNDNKENNQTTNISSGVPVNIEVANLELEDFTRKEIVTEDDASLDDEFSERFSQHGKGNVELEDERDIRKHGPLTDAQKKYINEGKTFLTRKCRRRRLRRHESADVDDIGTLEILERIREKTKQVLDKQKRMMSTY